jgi:peptidoglycan/xylan/chitin deacetylase (PgdA/CDA1 family)
VADVQRPGALVISLDFELFWGMRDHTAVEPAVTKSLVASRSMVLTLAELFARREVRATWATVGLLFATTAAEVAALSPAVRPAYREDRLDPYLEPIGPTEDEDPLHLAGSLVDRLASSRGQELASHTFSHFYCLEPGPGADAFEADLQAAQAAATRRGLRLRSLVLPRNQWDPTLAPSLVRAGFECYRGPQPGWAHRSRRGRDSGLAVRAVRLASTWAGPAVPTFAWCELLEPSGLCNIPASAFVRPWAPSTKALQSLQDGRIIKALRDAASRGGIVHLWWHPHNFVEHPAENLERLHRLIDELDRLRATDGMVTLTMGDVSDAARQERPAA